MPTFRINGIECSTTKSKKLLPFLRDDLHLTSVKNACSEGACGSCTVLLDGKAMKSCVLTTDRVDGHEIITCEGLSDREKEVYAYAFSSAGAVQCGFCIPGMVMAAKSLIDRNPEPTREDVVKAINGNICRCTGYVKIEDAILRAAEYFRTNAEVPKSDFLGVLGESMHRVDAAAKTLGQAMYADDLYFDDMVYGGAVRSIHPRARVLSIDASRALALPGVIGVVTADDIPGDHRIGYLQHDWSVLIGVGEVTRYIGDAIVLVAAETPEILEEAKKLVEIEYEVLKPILTVDDARKDEDLVHPEIEKNLQGKPHTNLIFAPRFIKGNADEAIKNSKYVVTTKFSTPYNEHAYMEPECSVAMPEGDDGIHLYTGDQGIYESRRECSAMLGMDPEKFHTTGMCVGGAFGGKNDMLTQHHAALIAWVLKCCVKVRLTRQESFQCSCKRSPLELEFTTACDENGYLTATKATFVRDNGAYSSECIPCMERAVEMAAGPYHYKNCDIRGEAWYTNNPVGGAFRGFSVPQTVFCTECNLNKLAAMVGISPYEIRIRNAVRPGDILANGQVMGNDCALVECLEALKEDFDAHPDAGIACAYKNCGVGTGLPDFGRVRLEVHDGIVHIYCGGACVGQGIATMLIQILCEVSGIRAGQTCYHMPDTDHSPDSGMAVASRHTRVTGEAARIVGKKLKAALEESGSLDALDGEVFLGEYSAVTDPMLSPKEFPVHYVAYDFAAMMCILGEDDKIDRFIAAVDVGRAINPISIEGQLEGGVTMALGFVLTENFEVENGLVTTNYGRMGLLRSTQIPKIDCRIIEKYDPDTESCGAKGCGEITTIPVAPAVQLAYQNRTGVFQTKLPLVTPYSRKK